ncbi:DNA polymerase IV [Sulfolobus acidocaldarius]|uniref:DNA polymerase IV n=5 Tax=Sulfolobaceae TaxID=118883 RepID=DPO4_SULAC|nr:DNA polymerase IV [Sulfolobus acidocaldarius]P96022.1 RecName: Full=DNA polymerase IV; Short=Pol IV [Saccharolobus solfataricus]Q4JB80.1 RecName: Full=DNA polymerase IV; Short=Pol IV [Sulfolobus acidocaldarius DSM 639]3BQ0_A Chain A, DNA polymerase IV [Sulfolobus acidocaldarius]3BQ1_A Chain A, DNA polymerase IV [Sulfolobus acidocaldarius]3BQ2_A Chain A, DNA polymerase IV [Sulfolobus acidocaldarius]4HYK_A Chain A, DNA polymerase IV [Sulfolobus acidocaldarius DSM 639]AAB38090.1 Dbh [Sacchar
MIVIFVDFDYFFAQVEEVLNPQYKGKPLVVCVYSGRTKTSGAVATANYEARKLGVKAGMPIIKAMQIAPSAIYVPMRKPIYEAFSNRIMNLLNKHADKIEVASIDEAYLDVTNKVEGNFENGIELARKIKQEILEKEKITVTVGVAPNKILAKIIADKSKPNGLGVIRPTEVQDFLNELDIDEIPGIGSVLARRLNELGIQKLRDILSKNYNELEKITGKAKALYLLKLAQNKYSEPVENKSKIPHGRYLTLPYNTRDVKVILPYLKKAINEAYNKVNGIPMRITVIAIMEDLDILSKGKKFKHGISIDNAYKVAEDLLRELLVRDKRRNVRRIGVKLDNIIINKTNLSDFFDI